MGEPLSVTQLIVVLERVAAETGLRVSQIMEVMQQINRHLELMQKEAEFSETTQALLRKSNKGSH